MYQRRIYHYVMGGAGKVYSFSTGPGRIATETGVGVDEKVEIRGLGEIIIITILTISDYSPSMFCDLKPQLWFGGLRLCITTYRESQREQHSAIYISHQDFSIHGRPSTIYALLRG